MLQQPDPATLADLRDIMVPPLESATFWPVVLFALSLFVLCYALFRLLRQRRFPWRSEVLSAFSELKQTEPEKRSLPLHRLLRQLALYENPNCSHLFGPEWSRELDRLLHTHYFSAGVGAELLSNLYSGKMVGVNDSVLQSVTRIVRKRTRWPW